MKTFTCEQRSVEWHTLRCGIPTASSMEELITPEFKVRDGEKPRDYTYKKLAEKVMGYSPSSLNTFHMEQGEITEEEAIGWFELTSGETVSKVGFCMTDDSRVGCSPDGLLGDSSGIEVKVPAPHTHIEYLCGGVLPKKYAIQVQTSMYVVGAKNWRFMSYSRFFPPFLITVQRDPKAQDAIATALDLFWDRFTAAEAKLLPQIAGKGRD